MRLTNLTPILNVSNVTTSLAWFEALGWEKGFLWDENGFGADRPTFASVRAGEAEIFLCLDCQGARDVWISWFLPSREALDAAHARVSELGYEVSRKPADESWGIREFHLRHPDGHTFRIGCEIG